jgi:hypothetical protein
MIELTNLLDRLLQFLIVAQPTANLGNPFATDADLARASASITDRNYRDRMALTTLAFRTATLVTDNPLQQRAAQELPGDRQLVHQLLAGSKGALANHPHE